METWSWDIIYFTYQWIWLVNISFQIFISMFESNWLKNLFCWNVLVGFKATLVPWCKLQHLPSFPTFCQYFCKFPIISPYYLVMSSTRLSADIFVVRFLNCLFCFINKQLFIFSSYVPILLGVFKEFFNIM